MKIPTMQINPTELLRTYRDYPGTAQAENARALLSNHAFAQTYGKNLDPERMEDLWQDLTAVLLNIDNATIIPPEIIAEIRQRLSKARVSK